LRGGSLIPTLNWIGKDKVINHHQDIPFKVLERRYSYGSEDSGNMIIKGDNLLALKSLLPQYEGRIKCIYIDPPYNTGNENWVYNDNVNDPKIKKWLGEVVGKDGEDLSRHDKWLCMMYPRLRSLQRLLSNDGAIFISIDDNEIVNLRLLMDEIFGKNNFVTQITLLCNPKGRSQDKYFATNHEYLLVYSKSVLEAGAFSVEKNEEKIQKEYKLHDEKGAYRLLELRNTHREFGRFNRPNLYYPIYVDTETGLVSLTQTDIFTQEVYPNWPDGFEGCWTWGKELSSKDESQLLGRRIKNVWKIYRKDYSVKTTGDIVKQKLFSIWSNPQFYTEKGQGIFGQIFPGMDKTDFPQPKSIDYVIEAIRTISKNDDIVLDSFAGSGTTAHAVLNINKTDGGNRKFILVEMMDYAETITAERIRRVIDGYSNVEGTGGSFTFYELGDSLILEDGNINETVDAQKIRDYVWYMETRLPAQSSDSKDSYFLGKMGGIAYYFCYEKCSITTLDKELLEIISVAAERYIIYADHCTLSKEQLIQCCITFKKIPRDISKL